MSSYGHSTCERVAHAVGSAFLRVYGQDSSSISKLCMEKKWGLRKFILPFALYLLGVVLNSFYFDSKSKSVFPKAANTV